MGRREDRPSNEQQLKEMVQLGIGTVEIVKGVHTANPALVQDGWKRAQDAAGPNRKSKP